MRLGDEWAQCEGRLWSNTVPVSKGEGPRAPGTRELKLRFDFYCNDADLGCADVFERVWSQGRCPKGSARQRVWRVSTIEDDGPVLVAANEFAYAENVERGGPTMGVQRSFLAGSDEGIENANAVVFEEQFVVLRCGD